MSLADLLGAELGEEDEEDEEDEDFVAGDEEETEDEEEEEEEDTDMAEEEEGEEEEEGAGGGFLSEQRSEGAPVRLHLLVGRGAASELAAVLHEGAYLEGAAAERFVERINRPDGTGATPLHHVLISAAVRTTVAAAGSDDPWAPDSARFLQLFLGRSADDVGESDTESAADSRLAAAIAADDAAAVGEEGGGTEGEEGAGDGTAGGHLECVRLLLAAGARADQCFFDRTALHLAAVVGCLPAAAPFAAAAADALLRAGANLCATDGDGLTPLHLAAAAGAGEGGASVLVAMVSAASAESLTTALHSTDRAGRTPLHAAVRAGCAVAEHAVGVLLSAGANAGTADHDGLTPLHLAAANCDAGVVAALCAAGAPTAHRDGFGRTAIDIGAVCGRGELIGVLPGLSAEAVAAGALAARRTHLYAHPACLLHAAPVGAQVDSLSAAEKRSLFGQPECADRLRTMLAPYGSLRGSRFAPLVRCAAPRAQLADVLRVHEWSYYDSLQRQCAALAARASAEPERPAIGLMDNDTEVTEYSMIAALHAAGAVVEAVRDVCAVPRRARNAFCAVRPPGHHAGPRGAVGGQSAGFCLFSTAAIGAAYALASHRDVVRRVAILDYDVHHGNGTQACVRNVRPSERVETFTCGAGALQITGVDFKPWLSQNDGDNVFFGSIHGFGHESAPYDPDADSDTGPESGQFYPGSGGPVDQSSAPMVLNSPVALRTDSHAWRREMSAKLLGPLDAFAPDLVIISAGFDAHAHDPLEAGALQDLDFEWMTAELVGLAEARCAGRLVSVLEGGYQITGGPVSSLGRAVAAHVATLMDRSLVRLPWDACASGDRLVLGIQAEAQWREARLSAMGAQNAPAQLTDGSSARRSKRTRSDVDYTKLQAEIEAEEEASAKRR